VARWNSEQVPDRPDRGLEEMVVVYELKGHDTAVTRLAEDLASLIDTLHPLLSAPRPTETPPLPVDDSGSELVNHLRALTAQVESLTRLVVDAVTRLR
jgi:hypothetical protein